MSAFDRIIGYKDVKDELMRICDVVKNPGKYRRLGVRIPRGILMDGEPGVGKTMMALSFIEESGCKSFLVRKSKQGMGFIGEIREAFDKARKEEAAIVLLDDMDKYANEDNYHPNAPEYVTVQSCIDDCRGFNILVIATVNEKRNLPDSLVRAGRFDKVIRMDRPAGKDAIRIIEYYLDQKQVVGNLDLEEIAELMEGYTCAELETVINEAGIYAAYEGRNRLSQSDLIRASMRMLFDVPESCEIAERPYIRKIAVHEAGHAVVSEMLVPGSVSLVTIHCHSWDFGGITKIKEQEEKDVSKKLCEYEIITMLSGKAATEMILGETDMGCQRDVDTVFYLVERLIDTLSTCGFDYYLRSDPSEYRRSNQERMVTAEVERYYREAEKIVATHRVFIVLLANELVKRRYLTGKDIATLRMRYEKYNNMSTKTMECTK